MDRKGMHAAICPMGGGPTRRHNRVRNSMHEHAKKAHYAPIREMPNLLDDGRKPADVYLPTGNEGGAMCVDVAVVHPCRADLVAGAADTPASAATSYEQTVKEDKYSEDLAARNIGFLPFVMEAFGGCGKKAQALVARMANDMKHRGRCNLSAKAILRDLSFTVMSCYARSVLERLPVMADD